MFGLGCWLSGSETYSAVCCAYRRAVAAAKKKGKSPEAIRAEVHNALIGKTTIVNPKLLMDNGMLPELSTNTESEAVHSNQVGR